MTALHLVPEPVEPEPVEPAPADDPRVIALKTSAFELGYVVVTDRELLDWYMAGFREGRDYLPEPEVERHLAVVGVS